jgi:hypothetical protein
MFSYSDLKVVTTGTIHTVIFGLWCHVVWQMGSNFQPQFSGVEGGGTMFLQNIATHLPVNREYHKPEVHI